MGAPKLELDWEVGVFRALRALWRTLTPAPEPTWDPDRVAHLADHARALTVLAQLIAGYPVRIVPARETGGVRGRDLLLPPYLDLAPDPEANRGLYVVRAAVSAAMYHRCAATGGPLPVSDPLGQLRLAREAIDWLEGELPGFEAAHLQACALALSARPPLSTFEGKQRLIEEARQNALRGGRPWQSPDLAAALAAAPERGPASPGIPIWGAPIAHLEEGPEGLTGAEEDHAAHPAPTSEAKARAIEALQRVILDEKAQDEAVLQHTFEKVETADSYKGGARDADGSDELADHLEALEEVDLSEVIRGGEPARSLLKADLHIDADVPDVGGVLPEERGVLYDEWDFRARAYRPGWCTVYPTSMGAAGDPRWADDALTRNRRLIEQLRRRLEAHRTERRPLGRQLDGEDIDVEALVDEFAARRAEHGGSPRLYQRRARRHRSFATTLLVDVSLSSDAWIDNRRVLDITREAALVLGEVAAKLGDQLQILAFASHTRNRCRVWAVKDFDEPWPKGRARLGALRPQGYTRIGPALRHGHRELLRAGADRRLLLLISDGKPTDFDRYEGRYGIADVGQALREARANGIAAHALAVDSAARDYLPAMFGPGAWHILPRPDALPEALSTVYGRMTAR